METALVPKPIPETIYAGFLKRVAAHIVDNILLLLYNLFLVTYIIVPIVSFIMTLLGLGINNNAYHIAIVTTGGIGWSLYYGLFESSSKQGTIGKQLMKIVVVDKNYKRASFTRTIIRAIMLQYPLGVINTTSFSWVRLFWLGIWLAMVLAVIFTRKSQGLHDILTGCLVINKNATIPPVNEI